MLVWRTERLLVLVGLVVEVNEFIFSFWSSCGCVVLFDTTRREFVVQSIWWRFVGVLALFFWGGVGFFGCFGDWLKLYQYFTVFFLVYPSTFVYVLRGVCSVLEGCVSLFHNLVCPGHLGVD